MNNNFNLKSFLAEGKLLNESTLEDDIKDFIDSVEIDNYQRSDDDYEEAEADLEFFLDMYPEYKGREEEIQKILNNNENPLDEIQVNNLSEIEGNNTNRILELIEMYVDNYFDEGMTAEAALTKIDNILQGNLDDYDQAFLKGEEDNY